MFGDSNATPTPGKITFSISCIISISNVLICLILGRTLMIALSIAVTTFIISYIVVYYYFNNFIQRKLKLIYKLIYRTKASKKETFYNEKILPKKSITEVETEVVRWAASNRNEIQQLRVNEQFRKEFLMNLTHELRTPIFTVQGYVHTLLDGAMEDPELSKRFLQNATLGIDRLVQLTNDLEQISKLEFGREIMKFEKFEIIKLFNDIYKELSLKAKEKNITLELKKDLDTHLTVYADYSKIKQALVNIIENAIKYGRNGGHVISEFWALDSDLVYIEVSDNGNGIEEKHISRVFERFYRTDESRNSSIGGTGLGLAIVKHIIEAHKQTINLRSKVGIGSSFGFTLISHAMKEKQQKLSNDIDDDFE